VLLCRRCDADSQRFAELMLSWELHNAHAVTLRDVYVFADTMIFKQQKGILFIINLKQDSKMSFTVQDIY